MKRTLLVACLALASMPLRAHAHTVTAPATVMALPDRSFSYDVTIQAGPGSATLVTWGWRSQGTIPADIIGDCFCDANCHCSLCPTVSAGESRIMRFEGRFRDGVGSATAEFSGVFCGSGGGFSKLTTITVPSVPAVPALPDWCAVLLGVSLLGVGGLAARTVLRTGRVMDATGVPAR